MKSNGTVENDCRNGAAFLPLPIASVWDLLRQFSRFIFNCRPFFVSYPAEKLSMIIALFLLTGLKADKLLLVQKWWAVGAKKKQMTLFRWWLGGYMAPNKYIRITCQTTWRNEYV